MLFPHRLPSPAVPAILLERENRFLARCQFPGGEVVHAHVPDRGRLLNLLTPGARVWLYAAPAGVRRTSWSLLVAEEPATGMLVAIDPAGANSRVRALLTNNLLPDLVGWDVRHEVTIGESRIDFLLSREDEQLAVEVKSVGVVRDGVARFPDAPTTRGVKHLLELDAFVRQKRGRARVVFVAQRKDAEAVAPDEEIDPDFARVLVKVSDRVELCAVRFEVTPDGSYFLGEIPVLLPDQRIRRRAVPVA
jgi:sugar fermentation stimulation protein A